MHTHTYCTYTQQQLTEFKGGHDHQALMITTVYECYNYGPVPQPSTQTFSLCVCGGGAGQTLMIPHVFVHYSTSLERSA